MGACQESGVVEVKRTKKSKHNREEDRGGDDELNNSEVAQLENKMRKQFPDMKEWKGNRYTGIGIKRMKGYKCNLPIDKLNEKRSEFWSSKSSEEPSIRKTWRVINQACVYDECKHLFYNY